MPTKLSTLSAACLLALASTQSVAAPPRVVTTVQPVQQLVTAVTGEVATPVQLVKGSASPHDYSLKPSDMRSLGEADVVFLIGPSIESFLSKPLENLQGVRVVTLMEAPGVEHLPLREGGAWEPHEHEHNDEHGGEHEAAHTDGEGHEHDDEHDAAHADDDGHDHGGSEDAHVWLDPDNARAIVAEIARVLSEVDQENASVYQANAQAFTTQLDALDSELAERLAPVADVPYVVFHDAYHYFEDHYGLSPIGAITIDPEQRPGAQRVQEIRDRIRDTKARCVFSEPQFTPSLVQTLIADTDAGTGTLDPLGSATPATAQGYLDNLNALADALTGCLAEG